MRMRDFRIFMMISSGNAKYCLLINYHINFSADKMEVNNWKQEDVNNAVIQNTIISCVRINSRRVYLSTWIKDQVKISGTWRNRSPLRSLLTSVIPH
jgi:hypothetical protein